MRKLYENIEDICINGNPAQLTEAITAMDFSLQNIADGTEQLFESLIRFSESNKGTQFQKIISTLAVLRDDLYQASIELNDMQNQIVAYQNKIFRYEDMSEYATAPAPHFVQRRNIHADVTAVQFNLAEMMIALQDLTSYHELVLFHANSLLDHKEAIGSIWCDSQYEIFAQFIDEVCFAIANALKEFGAYIAVLEDKIKELS